MMCHRKKIAWLLCFVFLFMIPQTAFAYTLPEILRVGLESDFRNCTSMAIGNGELQVGTQVGNSYVSAGKITSNTGFTAQPKSGALTFLDENFSDFSEAKSVAQTLSKIGLEASVAFHNGNWTVAFGSASVSQVSSQTEYDAVSVSFTGVLLKGNGISLYADTDTQFGPTDHNNYLLFLGSSRYRGRVTFSVNGSVMTPVNVVSLEQYLYGVVPAEMQQSYEAEALKAQAVAARTYAMTKLGAHSGSGYQLCDTTACQVYLGYDTETAATNAAVDATKGEIICYNGSPIEAVFSASMGGYTENSENVWSSVVPYLRAVPEYGEYGDTSWERVITTSDLEELMELKNKDIGSVEDIVITKISSGGRVQEMEIIGSHGSVLLNKDTIRTYFSAIGKSLSSKMFTINGKGGDIGTFAASGESSGYTEKVSSASNIQAGSLSASAVKNGITVQSEGTLSSLNGKNLQVNGLGIPVGSQMADTQDSASSEYEEEEVYISTNNGTDTYVFSGYGSGHGVGMSQKGAQYMAQMGFDYEEILTHYYTGVTIEKN